MAELISPAKAIRLKAMDNGVYRRRSPSPWHLQSPLKKHKTVCGIVIADHMGHQRRKLLDHRMRKVKRLNRPRWQVESIEKIRSKKGFCPACLGALIVK